MMLNPRNHKALVIGLALFSMFFGSGNLIFPFAVGQFAEGAYTYGALGFLATAVLVPFLGVITMLIYDGNYTRFFNSLGKRPGFVVTFTLLSFWIPLGSGPRCITLSYASLGDLLGGCPLWLFGLAYSTLVYILAYKRGRMMEALAYVLTPLLLLTLTTIVIKGILAALPLTENTQHTAVEIVMKGALEGYNTMDLIAAFFFSSTIIRYIKASSLKHPGAPEPYGGLAMQACCIGIAILASVYLGLMYIAAAHTGVLTGVAKDALLPALAYYLLGEKLGGLAAVAVALACLTTSLALAAVYTDFLKKQVFGERLSHGQVLFVSSLISWGLSTFGFEFLARLSEPAFQLLYPLLIVMMLCLAPRQLMRQRHAPTAGEPTPAVLLNSRRGKNL